MTDLKQTAERISTEALEVAVRAFMPLAEVAFLWTNEKPPEEEVSRYRDAYHDVLRALASRHADAQEGGEVEPVAMPQIWEAQYLLPSTRVCQAKDVREALDKAAAPSNPVVSDEAQVLGYVNVYEDEHGEIELGSTDLDAGLRSEWDGTASAFMQYRGRAEVRLVAPAALSVNPQIGSDKP